MSDVSFNSLFTIINKKQQGQKVRQEQKAKSSTIHIGDSVVMKNFGTGSRWLPERIVEMSGSVLFHMHLEDRRCKRCHQDHLRPRVVEDVGLKMSQVTSDNNIPISSPSTTENPTTEFSYLPPQAIGPLVIPVTAVNWLTPLDMSNRDYSSISTLL